MYHDSQGREIEDPEMDNMRRDSRELAQRTPAYQVTITFKSGSVQPTTFMGAAAKHVSFTFYDSHKSNLDVETATREFGYVWQASKEFEAESHLQFFSKV